MSVSGKVHDILNLDLGQRTNREERPSQNKRAVELDGRLFPKKVLDDLFWLLLHFPARQVPASSGQQCTKRRTLAKALLC